MWGYFAVSLQHFGAEGRCRQGESVPRSPDAGMSNFLAGAHSGKLEMRREPARARGRGRRARRQQDCHTVPPLTRGELAASWISSFCQNQLQQRVLLETLRKLWFWQDKRVQYFLAAEQSGGKLTTMGTAFRKTFWATSLPSADPGDGSNNARLLSSIPSLLHCN